MQKKLAGMWKPKGEMKLISLNNDFYLVKFALVENRDVMLKGGP